MAWISSGTNHWYGTYSVSSPFRLAVRKSLSSGTLTNLTYKTTTPYNFVSGKTYQFITNMWGYMNQTNPTAASFSIAMESWDEFLDYNQKTGATPSRFSTTSGGAGPTNQWPGVTNSNLYFYASPPTNTSSQEIITYTANPRFGFAAQPWTEGIVNMEMSEMNYFIQGFSYYKFGEAPYAPYEATAFPNTPQNGLGWTYDANYGGQELLHWYDHSLVGNYPVGGGRTNKRAAFGYKQNNYIAKFVPYSYFNLYFNYQNSGDFPLEIYMSDTLPNANPGSFSRPIGSELLCTLTQSYSGTYSSHTYSIPHAFYSVQGNRYLVIKGPSIATQSSGYTYSNIFITNMITDGGYHPGNNQQYLMTSTNIFSNPTSLASIGLTGATYSTFVGGGNTVNATSSLSVSQISANIGNGLFKAGIWENGVWNSGWRYDDGVYEFYNINQYFSYNRNKRWRVQIQGPLSSVEAFEVGDKVSIGNIVAIDINEDRKVIRTYLTIIDKTTDTIIVEFDNDFPLRRIERDSENHRIYITRNVWLSGAFFNGYFRGVWNYGLFRGYPLITEMTDTHWIDGIFDGGHFKSSYYTVPQFVDTYFYPEDFGGKVGLTFSQKHGLAVGDIITIDKNDKTINPQYDGETTIERVLNEYHVVISKFWGSDSIMEGGTVSVTTSKGLIQKIDFKSKNISKITSNQSMDSDVVFQYNSWMDINYYNTSAVNIGKPTTLLNSLSKREYSENNLYGYPTNDILESVSTFRDSFSPTIRKYSLGTKYKIFDDYIGESGLFQQKFGPTGVDEQKFFNFGWTYSRWQDSSLTFSRTEDLGDGLVIGEELIVDAVSRGGVLDIYPVNNDDIIGRTNEEIRKNRYTAIEFDLVTYSSVLNTAAKFADNQTPELTGAQKSSIYPKGSSKGLMFVPQLHFNNLNKINRNVYYSSIGFTTSTIYDATYLPNYRNINHLLTPKIRKIEYFFNKRNLGMHFQGNDIYSSYNTPASRFIIDNLKFYETNMIPFFKYFEDGNINRGVQIPYQGVSPFIDYSIATFNFVDNISIGLDSISVTNTTTPIGGIAPGITSNVSVSSGGGGIYNLGGSIFSEER